MRIHSSVLSSEDIYAAAKLAGVGLHRMAPHGSRSRSRSFDVILEGDGKSSGNSGRWGASGDYRAATWDQWGVFLGEVFRRDPAAMVPRVYLSADHFNWATADRFRKAETPADTHVRHRWNYDGTSPMGYYTVQHCQKCSAVTRSVAYGHDVAEVFSVAV